MTRIFDIKKTKDEYPRSFYFKLYKAFCKTLDVTCLCYGKMNKNDKTECIYAIDAAGIKQKLYCMSRDNTHYMSLAMPKTAVNKDDMQKAIVKVIMKVVKKSNIFFIDNLMNPLYGIEQRIIPQGLDFEKYVIEYDLSI